MSETNTENGGIKPYTSRGPEGCMWINTDVRGVYLTYFMVLFMRYRSYKPLFQEDKSWQINIIACFSAPTVNNRAQFVFYCCHWAAT